MKLVILDRYGDVVVELPEEAFRNLLLEYTQKLGDVGKAFDEIAKELKKRTLVV